MSHILITGAGGFIGKSLLRHIASDSSFDQSRLILLSSAPVEGYSYILHKNYKFTKNDFLEKKITEIDAVIHLGAFIPKLSSELNLYAENFSNVINTDHLLNNLPAKPAKFIFISTVDIYQRTTKSIDEQTPAIPPGFYGMSKLYCEHMVLYWCQQNQVIPQILRLGHIYGAGEEAYKKLIPETIRNVKQDKNPVIYSAGKEKRSYLHLQDCARAIWNSVQLNEYIGPVNIASSNAYSIEYIINAIIKISGKAMKPEILNKDIPVHDMVFDNQKMKKYLGDEQVSIEDGLKEEFDLFTGI